MTRGGRGGAAGVAPGRAGDGTIPKITAQVRQVAVDQAARDAVGRNIGNVRRDPALRLRRGAGDRVTLRHAFALRGAQRLGFGQVDDVDRQIAHPLADA